MPTVSYRSYSGTAAENYQRYFVPAIAEPVSVPLLAAAALRPGERVLDVGCGTGFIARRAAEQVGSAGAVTAIDLSPEMIEVARATPAPTAPPIEWQAGDAASLPFPDGAYDVALCQMALMFMENRTAAVSEMRRVLKPGGRAVVSTPGPIQPVFTALEQAIVEHIGADLGMFVRAVFSMHDPDAVATLLRDAGLHEVSGTVSPVRLRLPSPSEFLWQYISVTPLAPLVAQAPETSQEEMERQVVKAWHPHVVDGVVKVDQPLVVVSGRR